MDRNNQNTVTLTMRSENDGVGVRGESLGRFVPDADDFQSRQVQSKIKNFAKKMIKWSSCTQRMTFQKFIANGVFGATFSVKNSSSHNPDIAVKIQLVDDRTEKEVNVLKKFSDVGIGVKYHSHCYVKLRSGFGTEQLFIIIVMQKLDGLLDNLFQDGPRRLSDDVLDSIGRQLIDMIKTME